MNEEELQAQCEEVLRLHGFVRPGSIEDDRVGFQNLRGIYFHIPNSVFQKKKTTVNALLKNLPDLIVLDFRGRFLGVELKIKGNKRQRGQRSLAKIIPVTVCKTVEEFNKELEVWIDRV